MKCLNREQALYFPFTMNMFYLVQTVHCWLQSAARRLEKSNATALIPWNILACFFVALVEQADARRRYFKRFFL